jgi:hypothetical protein
MEGLCQERKAAAAGAEEAGAAVTVLTPPTFQLSFPRKRESNLIEHRGLMKNWMPAFAGVTDLYLKKKDSS